MLTRSFKKHDNFLILYYFPYPSQILSNVLLSNQPKFLSCSLSLTHTLFMSRLSLTLSYTYYFYVLIILACVCSYWYTYIFYLPILSLLSFACIFLTLFIWGFYRLPVYSFTSLFQVFFCLLLRITIMYFSFDIYLLIPTYSCALIHHNWYCWWEYIYYVHSFWSIHVPFLYN